jgi:hypothetical protein
MLVSDESVQANSPCDGEETAMIDVVIWSDIV